MAESPSTSTFAAPLVCGTTADGRTESTAASSGIESTAGIPVVVSFLAPREEVGRGPLAGLERDEGGLAAVAEAVERDELGAGHRRWEMRCHLGDCTLTGGDGVAYLFWVA